MTEKEKDLLIEEYTELLYVDEYSYLTQREREEMLDRFVTNLENT